MYVRNVDGLLNKKGLIQHMVEVNIYYQGHRERMEIDVIRGQKWTVILEMLWITCHNPEIDWRTGEVKMTRCSEKCGKQWRPKTRKTGVAKIEGERGKRRSRKKKRKKDRKTKEKKTEEGKDDGGKESSRRMGNLG